ncbi:hypothetical protein ACJJTC_000977 [Scirpophaga incertulas]
MMSYKQFLPTFFCAVTSIIIWKSVNSETEPLITTSLGQIRGYRMKTQGGKDISAFTAIPFAVPPVEKLRFEAPVPVQPWPGILDATKVSPQCTQRNPYIRQKHIVGQEDCLYLNIYTPYTSNELQLKMNLLPVMVFIHGGGWMCGDASTEMYGPEYLLEHDVLLVTINYRLGPLGFLSTKDKHCPGNNGLKDQQEALRFIQKTVAAFGGDKDSVTIFGESAGGASVHFHMLSETSAGLFSKAISESGTAMVPWAEASPGESEKYAHLLGQFMGCLQSKSSEMIGCLRTKSAYDIINTEFLFYAWDYEPMTPFKAVVEPDLPGAFLTKSVREIENIHAVPWLTGVTDSEGCLKSVWITTNVTRFEEFMSKFSTISPVTFYYNSNPRQDDITQLIHKKYLDHSDINEVKRGLLNMYTDSYFAYPMVEAVEKVMKSSKSSVFLYELIYRATNSFSQIFGDPEGNYGVCHADELMYLFPIRFLNKPISEKDLEIGQLIRTMWTNFAKSGNPNTPVKLPVVWKEATSDMDYLEIGSTLHMKQHLGQRSRFWASLPLWHKPITRRFVDEL